MSAAIKMFLLGLFELCLRPRLRRYIMGINGWRPGHQPRELLQTIAKATGAPAVPTPTDYSTAYTGGFAESDVGCQPSQLLRKECLASARTQRRMHAVDLVYSMRCVSSGRCLTCRVIPISYEHGERYAVNNKMQMQKNVQILGSFRFFVKSILLVAIDPANRDARVFNILQAVERSGVLLARLFVLGIRTGSLRHFVVFTLIKLFFPPNDMISSIHTPSVRPDSSSWRDTQVIMWSQTVREENKKYWLEFCLQTRAGGVFGRSLFSSSCIRIARS